MGHNRTAQWWPPRHRLKIATAFASTVLLFATVTSAHRSSDGRDPGTVPAAATPMPGPQSAVEHGPGGDEGSGTVMGKGTGVRGTSSGSGAGAAGGAGAPGRAGSGPAESGGVGGSNGGSTTTDYQVTRTAPYDYGCLPETNTCDDPDTKNGHLRSTTGARPCLTNYNTTHVCGDQISTSTGVKIAMSRSVKLVSVAVAVRLDPSVPAPDNPWACLRFVDESGQDSGTSCEPVPSNGTHTLRDSWSIGNYDFPSARLMVSLWGTGAVWVDSVSYTVR